MTTMHVTGRYPYKGILQSTNMIVELSKNGDDLSVRVDDQENLDFWLEITIPKEEVIKTIEKLTS